jgi:hypothetical protein
MPRIDESRGVLVVRIVYDGPAMSGKTTSLRALGRGLASSVVSPEERDGRTAYFDWLDYVGGYYDGRQIRCQIVSVPGQRELSDRRQQLLEMADAAVVVLDSRRPELGHSLDWLSSALQFFRTREPPVGVVVQANKRDAPDAVPRDEIRRALDRIAPVALVESVATVADGTREAFVLAVRLALDRARALSAAGKLEFGTPEEDDADALLAKLKWRPSPEPVLESRNGRVEDEGPRSEIAYLRPNPIDRSAEPAARDELIFTPDPMMPGGMIWPPVEGRTLLHEVAALDIKPVRTRRGDWWGSGSGWRFHSEREALYDDPDAARQELIDWARLHTSAGNQVSGGRAVILADAGASRQRLWQLVRMEPALRERLASAIVHDDPRAVASGVSEVANRLAAARAWFSEANLSLPCTLWTVADQTAYRPVYVGLMPRTAGSNVELSPRALIERELGPHLRELRRTRFDYPEIVAQVVELGRAGAGDGPAAWVADLIKTL